jgi:hypothetical protein
MNEQVVINGVNFDCAVNYGDLFVRLRLAVETICKLCPICPLASHYGTWTDTFAWSMLQAPISRIMLESSFDSRYTLCNVNSFYKTFRVCSRVNGAETVWNREHIVGNALFIPILLPVLRLWDHLKNLISETLMEAEDSLARILSSVSKYSANSWELWEGVPENCAFLQCLHWNRWATLRAAPVN